MAIPETNPVMEHIEEIADIWRSGTGSMTGGHLVVFRSREDASDLVRAFLAIQEEQPDILGISDLFATFTSPFLIRYDYCISLYNELVSRANVSDISDNPWWPPSKTVADNETLFTVFASFIRHHKSVFKRFVMVLAPVSISDERAWLRWLDRAIPLLPEGMLLVLCDTEEAQVWQKLIDNNGSRCQLLYSPADMLNLMQDTLHQHAVAGNPDSQRFRSLLLDLFVLFERGSVQQLINRAAPAFSLAAHNQWHPQSTVLHSMIAGGHLKNGDQDGAITAYRKALGTASLIEDKALRLNQLIQTHFSLAGAYYAGKEYDSAASEYDTGVTYAQEANNTWMSIEGWRMAGHCQLKRNQLEIASQYFSQAIHLARVLSPEERQLTSLPFLFQDLLLFHDEPCTQILADDAQRWLEDKSRIIEEVESLSTSLSSPVDADEKDMLDALLDKKLISAFNQFRRNREKRIRQASPQFQETIMLARQLLHSQWSGMPDVAHPLDEGPDEWDSLPATVFVNDGEAAGNNLPPLPNTGNV